MTRPAGWDPDAAVADLEERVADLEAAIRKHRDQRGAGPFELADEELYALLRDAPER